jgi:uncharacterized protein (TIRG00374 family)
VIRSLVLGLAVGAVFLALALWGVPLGELRVAFAQMKWIYLLYLVLVFALQYAIRAWRQLVLVRTLAPATSFRTQASILMIGFFCVNAFPARLGEAVRPYLWFERDGVPLGAGFGIVFLERILDLVALFAVLLAVIALVHVPDRRLELAGRSLSLVELGRGTAIAVLVPALMVLIGLAVLGPTALRIGARIGAALEARVRAPVVHRLVRFGLRFTESFVEGVRVLRSPARLAGVALLTAALFLSMGLMMWLLARAFELEDLLGFGAGMGVLTITMLGIALPAPPGFAGVFEAAARGGLALFGVQGEALAGRALAYALVFHWWQFLLLAASGGYFLWRDRIGLGRLFRFARGGSSAPAASSGSAPPAGPGA